MTSEHEAAGAVGLGGRPDPADFWGAESTRTHVPQTSSFPLSLRLAGVSAGSHDYKVVVQDNEGASTTSATLTVVVAANLLTMQPNGAAGTLTLQWPSGGMLQSAEKAEGPYSDLPNATSPWVVPTSEAMRFYRIRR